MSREFHNAAFNGWNKLRIYTVYYRELFKLPRERSRNEITPTHNIESNLFYAHKYFYIFCFR